MVTIMTTEPTVWVCVGVVSFLIFAIIRATYCMKGVSDDKSDTTEDLSDDGSDV